MRKGFFRLRLLDYSSRMFPSPRTGRIIIRILCVKCIRFQQKYQFYCVICAGATTMTTMMSTLQWATSPLASLVPFDWCKAKKWRVRMGRGMHQMCLPRSKGAADCERLHLRVAAAQLNYCQRSHGSVGVSRSCSHLATPFNISWCPFMRSFVRADNTRWFQDSL